MTEKRNKNNNIAEESKSNLDLNVEFFILIINKHQFKFSNKNINYVRKLYENFVDVSVAIIINNFVFYKKNFIP